MRSALIIELHYTCYMTIVNPIGTSIINETLHVLQIEDDGLQQALVRKQLEAAVEDTTYSLKITSCSSLEEGLASLAQTPFDALLLDLTLPDSAGISTIEHIRTQYNTLPIVVLTGDETMITSQLAIHQRAQEYLVKGEYSAKQLFRTILTSIERERLQQALDIAREQLTRNERHYRTLIEQSPDGVVVIDESDKVIFLNAKAETMLGRKSGHLLGESISIPLTAGTDAEIVIPSADGTLCYANLRILNSEWDNKPSRMLFLHDTTDKKSLEHQLVRSQRMESLGTLAGGIAHDLNNLLSPILLGVQAMVRNNSDEKQTKILAMIEQSTRRGADLVRQVLNFARGSDLQHEHINPETAVHDIVKALEKTLPENINIQVKDIDKDIPYVLADVSQLQRILMNLGLNARDAMQSKGGSISISASFVYIDSSMKVANKAFKEGKFIRFTVSDTGTGISDDVKPHIFEPFFTTKELSKGSGLGLYSVLNTTKRLMGFIDIETEVNKGTTVHVFIPISEKQTHGEHVFNVSKGLHFGSGENVLLIEDEVSLLNMASDTLRSYGYNVFPARTGKEALSIYQQHPTNIDVVLLDLSFSNHDSANTIKSLRGMNSAVKIVVASGFAEQRFIDEVKELKVQAFLAKPYTTDMMLNTLYESLR